MNYFLRGWHKEIPAYAYTTLSNYHRHCQSNKQCLHVNSIYFVRNETQTKVVKKNHCEVFNKFVDMSLINGHRQMTERLEQRNVSVCSVKRAQNSGAARSAIIEMFI